MFLGVTRPKVNELFKAIEGMKFAGIMDELAAVGKNVEERFPNEAEAYKQGLMDVANQIATAGDSEVSDNEKALMVRVAAALGLVPGVGA